MLPSFNFQTGYKIYPTTITDLYKSRGEVFRLPRESSDIPMKTEKLQG